MTTSLPTTAGVATTPEGIALRDWFAGQALVGMIPMPRAPGVLTLSVEGMAAMAYQYADALLKAREK